MDKAKFIPDQWPNNLFGVYRYSRELVKRNLTVIVVLVVLSMFASGVSNRLPGITPSGGFAIGADLVGILLGSLLSAALIVAYMASVRDEDADLQVVLKQAMPKTLNILLYSLITGWIAVLSLVVLIIPFFIIMPRLVLGQYMIVDKNLSAIEALKASWNMSRGNYGKIYKIIGAGFLMALLVLTLVGIPFAVFFLFMYQAAFFILYKWLDKTPRVNTRRAPKAPIPPKSSTPKPIMG